MSFVLENRGNYDEAIKVPTAAARHDSLAHLPPGGRRMIEIYRTTYNATQATIR